MVNSATFKNPNMLNTREGNLSVGIGTNSSCQQVLIPVVIGN